MLGMVVARRQFQIYTRDFHFLIGILDPHVGKGDLAIYDGQVQFTGKGNLGPVVPALILRLRFAELSIQFFFQLVVKLNAEDLPTLALDFPSGLLIEAIERSVVIGLPGFYETGVDRLVLWNQTLPP